MSPPRATGRDERVKTNPMIHQVEGCKRLATHPRYALGADMGTGKTWMLLADIEQRFLSGEIDAAIIIAPNGVHTNWILREIPKHLDAPHDATFWVSGASKRHQTLLERQLANAHEDPRHLVVHAMNVDAVNTKGGEAHLRRIFASFAPGRVAMIVDESHKIKNLDAKRTQRILALGKLAGPRRIASGTLMANSPLDLFSQYEFLAPGLLGTRSYRAFVSQYAELMSTDSALVQDIMRRTGARGAPQIIAKSRDGTPRYKNLDKLSDLIAPHTFRVTKEECLDLPPKIYQTVFFDMDTEQQRAYTHIMNERNWFRDDGEVDTFSALTVITKLRQVTSGFIIVDGVPTQLLHAAPRMAALEEAMEGCTGQFIVWASFKEELKQLAAMLREKGETFVVYHGDTKRADREAAVDDFQAGRARIFLGNPAAAGTGLTLTAAQAAIYYSTDFSLEQRRQSEDRSHRVGTVHKVVYIDLVARGTVDERIAASQQSKQATSDQIMGRLAWFLEPGSSSAA